jgi:hypothetical protein
VITPAQVHIQVLVLFRAGFLPAITVGEPGTQGAGITGTQGTGEPCAAITAGFVGAEHIPNGGMLTIGFLSMMVAAGILDPLTMAVGSTIMVDGATPKLHLNIAPLTTNCATFQLL